MDNSYGWIQRLLSNDYVCHNCGSTEHLIVECTSPGAEEWENLLKKVRDGLGERKETIQDDTPPELAMETPKIGKEERDLGEQRNQQFFQEQRKRNPLISFTLLLLSRTWWVERNSVESMWAGNRNQGSHGTSSSHRSAHGETNFIPQRGHEPKVENNPNQMLKFCDWTKTLKYGKLRPIGVNGEDFVDPLFSKV